MPRRAAAIDLTQRLITDGAAGTLVGRSCAPGLPGIVRWVPLRDTITVTVALVLTASEPPPTVQRFLHVARAHAAAHGWLP
jgi:hypothetical protein